MKVFLQRILQEIMKKKWYLEHQTLGRQFICPIGPGTEHEFILDWRISKEQQIIDYSLKGETTDYDHPMHPFYIEIHNFWARALYNQTDIKTLAEFYTYKVIWARIDQNSHRVG